MSGNKLSSFSVILVYVVLVLIGISLIPFLNLQLAPSRSLPSLNVTYSWPNASSKLIEQEVTAKLEGLFNSVRGIEEISSVSNQWNGKISLKFKKGVNLDAVRFELATIIRRSYPDLPQQVSYPELSLGTGGQNLQPILSYTLNASTSPFFIQKYAEDIIVSKISVLKGVNEVKVYGASPFVWEIKFDTEAIRNLSIEVDEIARSINNYFRKEVIGMGKVKAEFKEIPDNIRVAFQYDMPETLSWNQVPITKIGNRIVWLTDIATVNYKEQVANSYHRINGLNTINIVVYPEEGVNHVKLAKNVKQEFESIGSNLPVGYSFKLAKDNTEFVLTELRKIGFRTLFSVAILMLFVLIITRSFRYLLLITISLIANLTVAFLFYYLFKIEIHLYSLAGITLSFGILIDNSIIMIDHLRYHNNKKAFLAVLAATLTTLGSVCVIFFLTKEQRIDYVDFALVFIVNLSVSMGIALFFIPALMDKIKLRVNKNYFFYKRKRYVAKIVRYYGKSIVFSKRFKWVYIVLIVLGFGLPVYLLPNEINQNGFVSEVYNSTIGNWWYQNNIRPVSDKIIGGTLRLFTEHVFEDSFYSDPQETKLYVRGSMPEGCTVQQLNEAVRKMESYISEYYEIELYHTSIRDYKNASITIHFKPEYEKSSFPSFLKEELALKAVSLGGVDWSVYGVGRAFSNAMNTDYKSNSIVLEGYNYDRLYHFAEGLKEKLLKNQRISEVDINGGDNYGRSQSVNEFYIDFDEEQFGLNDISTVDFYSSLRSKVYSRSLTPIFYGGENQPMSLVAEKATVFNVWDLNNYPFLLNNKIMKLSDVGLLLKRKTGNEIHKYNQQYRLNVAFNLIGPYSLAKSVKEQNIEEMNMKLPLGFLAKEASMNRWNKDRNKQYYLLLLIMVIIFFLCSILFESLIQPFVIILIIPISYIGVFLTFYLFDFNFDQGGFASFLLLSGIVVNAGIYIINDYNNLRRRPTKLSNLNLYLKAFNHKIIPICLTIISTILGLIPFVWLGQDEAFWFAFAVGAIGGLIFSIVAILIYLPLFLKLKI